MTLRVGENESWINFISVRKENQCFLGHLREILWEIQHRLLVVDIDKNRI